MRVRLFVALALFCADASAHRVDEYLQATMLKIGADRVDATLRLVPGQAMAASVIAAIDTDGDGVFSVAEQRAYVARVLGDVTVAVDGRVTAPVANGWIFPPVTALRDGLAEIRIDWSIGLPAAAHAVVVTNRHRPDGSVYLANVLVPQDPDLHVVGQRRDARQSRYEVDLLRGDAAAPAAHDPGARWGGLFRLGLQHIAEGADHLLFLLTLLLVAPLRAAGSRWTGLVAARVGLRRVVGIVTAFTVGHSLTLMAAAVGGFGVPSRPVEVAIAGSIVVSAVHAIRPLFAGREALVAAGFGLVHGLAFATTLDRLGVDGLDRAAGTLAFNAGIEAMQLVVVAVALPIVWLFATTRAARAFRIAAATIAGLAAAAWIVERLCDVRTPLDRVVDAALREPVALVVALYALGLACRVAQDGDPRVA